MDIWLFKINEPWVQRPWGKYKLLFQVGTVLWVKVLKVHGRTSLQRHAGRGEWWLPIGWMFYQCGLVFEYTRWPVWIPRGCRHRIGNGKIHITLIEIGIGNVTETDVERLQDDYGR